MDKIILGSSDLKVSKICLGTMTFGEQNTEAEGHSQLDYALERGINFIDTAEMYPVMPRAETTGSTESIIGSWLKKSGKRSEVVLATKVAGPLPSVSAKPSMIVFIVALRALDDYAGGCIGFLEARRRELEDGGRVGCLRWFRLETFCESLA